MRILLVPQAFLPGQNSMHFLCTNMLDVMRLAGHAAAVCCPKNMSFKASVYFAPEVPKRFFCGRRKSRGRTYEEYLDSYGASSEAYLRDDIKAIVSAAEDFKPDLIIDLGRPQAQIAARSVNITCRSVVHSGMYRTRSFDSSCLDGFNSVLSEYRFEQIHHITDLYTGGRRIIFGLPQIQPFSRHEDIGRYGYMGIKGYTAEPVKRLCVVIGETSFSTSKLHKIFTDAFLGAPYEVCVCCPDSRPSVNDNLHFAASLRPQLIYGSQACIHDGSSYLFHQCIAAGIPQLIIADSSYERMWNAAAAERYGFGLYLSERDLSMETVYEKYRSLLSDDIFAENAAAFSQETSVLGDLYDFVKELEV